MSDWSDLWNPVVVLGGFGTLGVVASLWVRDVRAIVTWCLIGMALAMLSWSQAGQDDVARGAFAVSVAWGLLLCVSHWPHFDSLKRVDANEVTRFADEQEFVRSSAFRRPSRSTPPEGGTTNLVCGSTALPLQLVLLASLCLTASAGDVVSLFVGLQVIAVGTHALSPHTQNARLNLLLAVLLLFGLTSLATLCGSTRIDTIAEALRTSYVNHEAARSAITGGGSRLLTLSIVFVGTALASSVFAVPFHARVVDQVVDAPLSSASLFLLLPRAAGLLVWLRLWPSTLTSSEPTAQLLVGVLAAITFVVPLLQARDERRLVRQWTLLAVAQGGWLLLAMAARSVPRPLAHSEAPSAHSEAWPVVEWNLPNVAQSAWLWLLFDGVALIGLFGVLVYLRRRDRPTQFVDDLQGLRSFEPLAAGCASVCLFSLAGVPLLSGWWSRLFVALSAMDVRGEWGPPQMLVPHDGLLILTALAALSSVWSLSVAGRSVWTMLFGLPLGQPRPAGSPWALFTAVLASLMLLGCGILPRPLLSWLCGPE